MEFEDKTLSCRDCGAEFLFTAGEQWFYLDRGLLNEPHRCPGCRTARRRPRATGANGTREMTQVTCAGCGTPAQVPFVPRLDRPVYCDDCFTRVRTH